MRYEYARGAVPPPWTVIAWSRRPVYRPSIPVLAVTRCSEYEKKVSLWVKKKMDNDLHDNTE